MNENTKPEEIELLVNNCDDNNKKNEAPLKNSNPAIKERLYWVDALRIFAAYSVIFIHCTDVDLKPMKLFSFGFPPTIMLLFFQIHQ